MNFQCIKYFILYLLLHADADQGLKLSNDWGL